jgi:hypothetical protein
MINRLAAADPDPDLGAGWIVTAFHCVHDVIATNSGRQRRETAQVEFVQIVTGAIVTLDGTSITVSPQNCTMVVFTNIAPALDTNIGEVDLALLRIPEFSNMPAVSVPDPDAGYNGAAIGVRGGPYTMQIDDETSTLHYGWVDGERPQAMLISDQETVDSTVCDSSFTRRNASTTWGSSGSPIFTRDCICLAGVHYAIGDLTVNTNSLFQFMQDNVQLQAHFEGAERYRALGKKVRTMAQEEEDQAVQLLIQEGYGVHQLQADDL